MEPLEPPLDPPLEWVIEFAGIYYSFPRVIKNTQRNSSEKQFVV